MLTTDKFLIKLIDEGILDLALEIPIRDKKTLLSLRQQLKRQYFLTEKQGNLLVKLLESNEQYFKNLSLDELHIIKKPLWSEHFREKKVVRRIYFTNEKKDTITVEFTHDNEIKKKLGQEFTLLGSRKLLSSTANKFVIHAHEYNIFTLLNLIKKDNFSIDSDIVNLYNNIKSTIEGNQNFLDILQSRNSNLYNLVVSDLQDIDDKTLFLLDRRIKFQYDFTTNDVKDTLEYKIANRSDQNVYVNSDLYSLQQVIDSLGKLKRFPCTIIFDPTDIDRCNITLDLLNDIVKNNEFLRNVGIYFRFENDVNKEFNQKISEYNFNTYLDSNTNIIGLSTKHLPKFLFKSSWYPKSVITISSNFRNRKFFQYFNKVDLIVCHASSRPLTGKYHVVM